MGTKLMWTNLVALPPTNHFLPFQGCAMCFESRTHRGITATIQSPCRNSSDHPEPTRQLQQPSTRTQWPGTLYHFFLSFRRSCTKILPRYFWPFKKKPLKLFPRQYPESVPPLKAASVGPVPWCPGSSG